MSHFTFTLNFSFSVTFLLSNKIAAVFLHSYNIVLTNRGQDKLNIKIQPIQKQFREPTKYRLIFF